MTTPKKPIATGSYRGESEAMGELMITYKLKDQDAGWMSDAKCYPDDGITWFPEQGQATLTMQAKNFCGNCAVRERCLEWALNNEIMYGVWGGRSPYERKRTLYARKYKAKMTL